MISGRTPHERWENIATVLFGTGVFFAVLTVYGIWKGEEVGGTIMSVGASAILLALWRVACWRRDK